MRLLVPACPCSFCGESNPNRITERERDRYRSEDPCLFIGTFRCSRCHRITRVSAAAYQLAEPVGLVLDGTAGHRSCA